MSLQSPDSKMSKSDPNQNGTLYITDEPSVLQKKIMSAVTDSDSSVRYDVQNKPGVSNLMSIMAAFTQKTYGQIEDEFSGKGYGDFKKAVAEVVIESLAPVRQSYKDYSSDKAMIEDAIKKGSQAATRRTTKMMAKVYRKVGFLNFEK